MTRLVSSGPRAQTQWFSPRACDYDMSEGDSPASGEPGFLSHDDVDGWLSGAENVKGWGKLIFSNHGWPQVITEREITDKGELLHLFRAFYVVFSLQKGIAVYILNLLFHLLIYHGSLSKSVWRSYSFLIRVWINSLNQKVSAVS